MPQPAGNPPPTCPRCGYDQSGGVAAWSDACPLRGTCSECGAEFDWERAFRHAIPPYWSFEHGRAFSPRRAWGTVLALTMPWSFWLMLEPRVPVRLGRILLLAAGVFLVGPLLLTVFELFENAPRGFWWRGAYIPREVALQAMAFRFGLNATLTFALAHSILCLGLVVPSSDFSGTVARLLRAWGYSLVACAAIGAGVMLFAAVGFGIGMSEDTAALRAMIGLAGVVVLVAASFWPVSWWVCSVSLHLHLRNGGRWLLLLGLAAIGGTVAVLIAARNQGWWPV